MLRTSLSSSLLLVGLSLAAGVSLAPRSALAQSAAADTARATELFKNGKVAFGKGDMAEAERLFAQALELRQSSDIAANLAQSQLEQQKFRAAAENFSWALANLLPSATDTQRRAVENGLAKARAEVAVLRLDIKPDGSDVLVGEHSVGKSPLPSNVFVDAGEVIISVKHDGFVAIDKRVMAAKGTEQAVEIQLTPKEGALAAASAPSTGVDSGLASSAASGPDAAADKPAKKSLVPAYVATGVAVAGGVAGLVFTLSANSKEDDADELAARLKADGGNGACSGDAVPADCSDLKTQRESVDSSRNLALGAFVVGGVAAVVAGYFYWDALAHRSGASASRAPSPRPRSALLPSVELSPAGADGVRSFKLGVSGNF